MPKFHVSKSIIIQAPIEEVYNSVRDFPQWPIWSPWLIAEPECIVTTSDDGNKQAWDGKIIGAGEISITSETRPNEIGYFLQFLRPWKSKADCGFRFQEKDGGVEATWFMDSSLPFFLFFMRSLMVTLIGMDYDRGLRMLKDHLETGSVPSKLDFPGPTTVEGVHFVGIKTETTISELAPSMDRDLAKLREWLESATVTVSGKPFSIYHQWNPVKGRVGYTIAFPLGSIPHDLPDGMTSGERPTCETYPVKHTGNYKHLGNAWSAGISHDQAKVFRKSKKLSPFEIYETPPGEGADDEHVVTVHFPVK